VGNDRGCNRVCADRYVLRDEEEKGVGFID
jgi:hypothetical protein